MSNVQPGSLTWWMCLRIWYLIQHSFVKWANLFLQLTLITSSFFRFLPSSYCSKKRHPCYHQSDSISKKKKGKKKQDFSGLGGADLFFSKHPIFLFLVLQPGFHLSLLKTCLSSTTSSQSKSLSPHQPQPTVLQCPVILDCWYDVSCTECDVICLLANRNFTRHSQE